MSVRKVGTAARRLPNATPLLIIRTENQADVLAGIVQLFQNLNVDIEALYMVRRRGSEAMRISVTIEANREVADRVEANLCELAKVRSVKIERAKEKILSERIDEESKDRHQA